MVAFSIFQFVFSYFCDSFSSVIVFKLYVLPFIDFYISSVFL